MTDATDASPSRYHGMSSIVDLIWKRRRSATASLPEGHRVYAIGDIHGRDDLVETLLGQVEADDRARGEAITHIIFLGDYIDRGPQSREVIERLRNFAPGNVRPVFLAGNHEEVLLRLLAGDDDQLAGWLQFGGAECLASYGVDPAPLAQMPRARAAEIVRRAIPPDHVRFLRTLCDTFRIGDYLFVHAGIRPGIALDDQVQADLRWIRRPFLDTVDDHGFVVVHGHSISKDAQVRPNRIGLDTGAYRSGVLTALGLEGAQRWFLQTGHD